MFEIVDGRLMIGGSAAAFAPTPNQGGRLEEPTLVVLHDTAGRLTKGTAVAWLCNPQAKASAHVVVERDGTITQLVNFNRVAWHAGRSSWRGRSGCNAFAVGIEIVNPGKLTGTPRRATAWFGESFGPEYGIVHASTPANGDGCWMPYTEAQLHTVEQLITALGRAYPIGEVVAHHDIAPGRKVDTTPLMDFARMRAALEAALAPDGEEEHQHVAQNEEVTVNTARPVPMPVSTHALPPEAAPAPAAPSATPPKQWATWKIPLAFAAGAAILWAVVTGKINNEEAQRLFSQLLQ